MGTYVSNASLSHATQETNLEDDFTKTQPKLIQVTSPELHTTQETHLEDACEKTQPKQIQVTSSDEWDTVLTFDVHTGALVEKGAEGARSAPGSSGRGPRAQAPEEVRKREYQADLPRNAKEPRGDSASRDNVSRS